MFSSKVKPLEIRSKSLAVGMPIQFNSNPYQAKIVSCLSKAGIVVNTEEFSEVFKAAWKREKLQIVHLNWLHKYLKARNSTNSLYRFLTFLARLLILRLKGVKIVWTIHNLSSHEESYPRIIDFWARKVVCALSSALIVHCEKAKEEVIKKFGVWNESKIFLIPHGNYIEMYENTISVADARENLGIQNGDKAILFMGIIRPYNGLSELIYAFRNACTDKNIRLYIVGKVIQEEEIKLISDLISDCQNIVFVPGYVPDGQVQIYMNACDLVVLPYKNTLTSGAAILAMSFGKACIAPDIGCMSELFGEDGAYLYDSEDSKGLEDALKRATSASQNQIKKMGSRNLEVAKSWDWHSKARKFIEVYEFCLKTD